MRLDPRRAGRSCFPALMVVLASGCSTTQTAIEPAPEPANEPFVEAAMIDEAPPESARRVTSAEEGASFDPAITPDGEKLVFASTDHRTTSDLYVMQVGGHVVTRLTNDQADDAMPAVSPDGERIAFASNRSGNWDIFVMPITGGQAVQVTSESTDELHPSWSADGSRLAYSRSSHQGGRWEVWVTEVAHPAVAHFIGHGMHPRWSPVAAANGNDRILYQLGRERGSRSFAIWSVEYSDGQTRNPTRVMSSGSDAFINPSWTADGQRIVFASVPASADSAAGNSPGGESALWMLSLDGSQAVKLVSSPRPLLSPACASNDKLYFVGAFGGNDNVWSIDLRPTLAALAATTGAPTAKAAPSSGHAAHEATTVQVPSTSGDEH